VAVFLFADTGDYAITDLSQLRFKPGSKLKDNFYVRWDGTCSYFFDRGTHLSFTGRVHLN